MAHAASCVTGIDLHFTLDPVKLKKTPPASRWRGKGRPQGVIGLEGGDLHHNGTHWLLLLISRKDRVPNRNMRTIRRLCAAGPADSILTGSRYLTRTSPTSPAGSPLVLIRQTRIGLVDPSSDHATICYAPWRTGKANAHVNEEHVVERRAEDQPPTVVVIDDDPGVRDSLGKLLGACLLYTSPSPRD